MAKPSYETQNKIYQDVPELRDVEVRREDGHREIKSYVLRGGYIHASDVEALKRYYPTYGLPFEDKVMDFRQVFGNDHPVVMEIGFGNGVSTAKIAKERDGYNYLALEVFISGFAKLMKQVGEEEIRNLRLMRFDAVAVLEHMIPDDSLAGFHVFFPDPWQKKKHHKRRLIQQPMADLMARKLHAGGYMYCVTDWEEYAEQMLDVFSHTEGIRNAFEGYATPRPWRPMTHFEQKGLKAERPIRELWFEKEAR
ncbi:MAG: tRNA (guanosine(46)-N7)-methyltransferase TrmB [Sphaerochaetaceae bacterium]|jgi:tRNA (guanine-N7-)-methyltransferase|nr:tRNA (guanosine(46)-N7)-methyltransferase TrmB [Spirochaetaceae bacterium]MDY6343466.1 tRNA (guanosine(46)-N7)-methyltransferase TrmB [Sphaerochaetaceae bacterium]